MESFLEMCVGCVVCSKAQELGLCLSDLQGSLHLLQGARNQTSLFGHFFREDAVAAFGVSESAEENQNRRDHLPFETDFH